MSEVKYLDKTGLGTVWDKVKALVSPKADKSEMSVTPGTGDNADKTTIQLKQGTSATVLTQHQDISGKADKDTDAVEGHLAKFDANGNPVDGDIAINNVAQKDGSYDQMQVGVAKDLASSQSVPAEIVFRNTGGSTSVGKGGTAIIDRIKGKTLAWNQLLDIVNGSGSVNGISFSINNGIITLNGTATETAPITISNNSFGIPVGHKVLFSISQNFNFGAFSLVLHNDWAITAYLSSGSVIVESNSAVPSYWTLRIEEGVSFTNDSFYLGITDLTLLYGSEIDGMTDAEILAKFESEYPGYHDHEPGTLISNDASAIETVGFNQWDEEWELGYFNTETGQNESGSNQIRCKNYIPVLPNADYYCKCEYGVWAILFDANFGVISLSSWSGGSYTADNCREVSNAFFHTANNAAYLRFYCVVAYGTTYNHDICINLSDPSRNGTYEPYWKSQVQLNLNDFYVKDPSGGADIHITGGLKSAGDVYDEIVGNKYIKRVGSADLGDLNWLYSSGDALFFSNDLNGIAKGESLAGILCSKYISSSAAESSLMQDKSVVIQYSYSAAGVVTIKVKDSDYSDPVTFKAAMSGVMLYYELATPIEYELVEALPTEYRVDSHGTERRLPEGTASSVHAPFAADITYSTNIKETVENLPKNYINVDSMHAFLAALGTAMNGEWDMRQGNGRFIFTFTPNTPNTQNENE